jgi:hypothetical protein
MTMHHHISCIGWPTTRRLIVATLFHPGDRCPSENDQSGQYRNPLLPHTHLPEPIIALQYANDIVIVVSTKGQTIKATNPSLLSECF